MKRILLLSFLSVILLSACTKRDYVDRPVDPAQWMRTHDKGIVAYVDYYTGNYVIDTYGGFSVIESFSGYTPREYDEEYAYFGNRGLQTIYNWNGNYFTNNRVVDSWLTWSDAMYVLDQISYGK
jgi:hypothetical protein